MAKLIEKGTNYAYTIERIKDITFAKLRSVVVDFTRRLPADLNSELYEAIQHGVCQLQSEPELNMYIHALGLMHEAKLQHAFEHLPVDFTKHTIIDIIDYGCGQAIGTICYADFLRKNGYAQNVRKITLIEPSEIALKRAALHVSCFFPNAEIITLNKGFDDLVDDDICTDDNIPTLHILSNVIDLADDYFNLENFAELINNNAHGENHYICIEPYFDYDEQDEKLKRFSTLVAAQPHYSKVFPKGSFVEGRDWTCNVIMLKRGISIYTQQSRSVSDNYTIEQGKEQSVAQVANQETTPQLSDYLNVIKTLIQNGGKRINSNRIKNVNYTEKDNYTMVSLTLTNPIPGYISEDNGITYKLGNTNVVFTSLYAIVGALKEDEDLSWLGNALLNKPSALNLILNGGVVDIIQQEIPANTVFTNPFSTSSNPESQVYGHDIILNHCIKFRLGKTGRKMSLMLAKATEQNDTSAQYELGYFYYNGQGVEQDYSEAVKWYREAAEQGNANAQNNLGVCYANGQGVERDYTEAVEWYRKAAEQGNVTAILNLAKCYERGSGAEKNFRQALKWYQKAAELGDKSTQHFLARLYHKGKDVPQSDNEAIKWYIKAAKQGCTLSDNELTKIKYTAERINSSKFVLGVSVAIYNEIENNKELIAWTIKVVQQGYFKAAAFLGNFYEEVHHYSEAIIWYRKAAEQGDAYAQRSLGWCYDLGNGVTKDIKEAVKWYRKAAEQGDKMAMRFLANRYKEGKGIEQDFNEAVKWYIKEAESSGVKDIEKYILEYSCGISADTGLVVKFAEKGYAKIQHQLAERYKATQSYEKAEYWYLKSIENGYTDAYISLGSMYVSGKGVVQNYEKALNLYLQAAELGNQEANYEIAKLYALGRGVEKSYEQAVDWLNKYKNTASGLFWIGNLFYNGLEIAQSYEEAVIWWKMAAEANHRDAKYMLGLCYEQGQGVKQSYEEAVKWWKAAMDDGYVVANVSLGILYEQGKGVEKSYEKAVELYRSAAEKNYSKAMFYLGNCYRYGLGVERSYKETVKWYKMAASVYVLYDREIQSEAKAALKTIYVEDSLNLINKFLFWIGFLK